MWAMRKELEDDLGPLGKCGWGALKLLWACLQGRGGRRITGCLHMGRADRAKLARRLMNLMVCNSVPCF